MFCKFHADCNVEGQYHAEACFKCRMAMMLINQSDDALLITRTVASLRKWTNGMCRNRGNHSEDTPFWKSEVEKKFLTTQFKLFLSHEEKEEMLREWLGDVAPPLLIRSLGQNVKPLLVILFMSVTHPFLLKDLISLEKGLRCCTPERFAPENPCSKKVKTPSNRRVVDWVRRTQGLWKRKINLRRAWFPRQEEIFSNTPFVR